MACAAVDPISGTMGLWNSNANTKPPVAPPPGARTFTNAPRHWPAVSFAKAKAGPEQFFTIVGTLAEPLEQLGATMATMRTYVYDDGVLEVPLVFEENGTTTCVFYYPAAGPDAAAHYASVRKLLKEREGANTVFYCPEPMGQGTPRPVLGVLEPRKFSKPQAPPPGARYAIWWTTPEDPTFTVSEDRVLLDRWFEALHGYAHVMLSLFLHELGVLTPKDGRPQLVGLPEEPFALPLVGPGGVGVLLKASTADGFMLAFDTATISAARRRTYLRLLVQLAEGCRARALKERIHQDAEDVSLAAWRAVRDETLEVEAAGQAADALCVADAAGGNAVTGAVQPPPLPGQPPPLPGASGDDATPPPLPQSGPALPSNDAFDAAIGLIENAAASLREAKVVASTDEQLGAMNLSPVILVKANGHTWRRTLVYDGGDAAIAAAGRMREEWPDASLVAVLVDGAIREDDTRVDCLRVLLQEGETAASLFWRYATVGEGSIELYGRPAAQPVPAFVAAPQPPPFVTSGFDAGLFGLASEAFGYIEKFMAVSPIDAERAARYRTQPLSMPFAMTWDDTPKPSFCKFALAGPHGAREGCRELLRERPAIHSVAFTFDDVLELDHRPHRRIRVHVQRRGMPAAAIVERPFELPPPDAPFAFSGEPAFVRWTESLLG
jgi:hypothetical protein